MLSATDLTLLMLKKLKGLPSGFNETDDNKAFMGALAEAIVEHISIDTIFATDPISGPLKLIRVPKVPVS